MFHVISTNEEKNSVFFKENGCPGKTDHSYRILVFCFKMCLFWQAKSKSFKWVKCFDTIMPFITQKRKINVYLKNIFQSSFQSV